MTAFLPGGDEIRAIARRATLRNTNPAAKGWLMEKLERPPADWDARALLSVPGVVWTVSSDTCATGRLSAPNNVAYDHYWREFVFRQPRDEEELAAVMSADSEEVFSCYRFDGLDHWTRRSVGAWFEDSEVILGYIRNMIATTAQPDTPEGLRDYEEFLASEDFRSYIGDLQRHLARNEQIRRAAA